ncbi:hypothetical protein ECB41_A0073 [Escherichia coli B41]|nr:hypothetical protein ECB41_A0073 [Escherichia coli B41]
MVPVFVNIIYSIFVFIKDDLYDYILLSQVIMRRKREQRENQSRTG